MGQWLLHPILNTKLPLPTANWVGSVLVFSFCCGGENPPIHQKEPCTSGFVLDGRLGFTDQGFFKTHFLAGAHARHGSLFRQGGVTCSAERTAKAIAQS